MTAKGTLPTPLDTALRQQARSLWEAGESYGAIECEIGVKPSTLKSWRKRAAWTRTKPDELAIVEQREELEFPEDLPSQVEQYEDDMRRAALTFSRYVAGLAGETITAKSQHIKHGDSTARKALNIETEKPRCAIQIGVLVSSPAKRSQDVLPLDDEGPLPSLVRPREAASE